MIRFPKMHIAKSTVNRILNASDEIDRDIRPDPSLNIPSIPVGDPSGKIIERATTTPVDPVSAPPGISAKDVLGPERML